MATNTEEDMEENVGENMGEDMDCLGDPPNDTANGPEPPTPRNAPGA